MKELIPKHDMPGTDAPLFVDGKELITMYNSHSMCGYTWDPNIE